VKSLQPHRLGGFTAAVAGGAILASALLPGVMPEIPLVASALLVLFVFVRYVLGPRLLPARHALQLVDRERTLLLALACGMAMAAAALAWRRRLPDFSEPPPLAEAALFLIPLLVLVLAVITLSRLHRQIVDHTLWTPAGSGFSASIRWVAPVLAALFLPVASAASGRSDRWQARVLFARIGHGMLDARSQPVAEDMAGPLADLLWASEPRTSDEKARLQAQTRLLLSDGRRFQNVRALIETRLGIQSERGLATLRPGEEAEATARFANIAAGARRPFVRIWQERQHGDVCQPPRGPVSQEWLWLLANVCQPADAAAAIDWWKRAIHPWLRPEKRWTFRGTAWTARDLPPEDGFAVVDGSRLVQQPFGEPDRFEEEVLGRQVVGPCAERDWKVVHVWRPPTDKGGAAWEGGIALSRRTRVCWEDSSQQKLRFGGSCLRDGRVRLKIPIVLVIRASSPPAGSGLGPADRRLHTDVFGRREGKKCQPPSQYLAVRPIFMLESTEGQDGF
jgi:hypothetical protein